jgi:hypothetical protein
VLWFIAEAENVAVDLLRAYIQKDELSRRIARIESGDVELVEGAHVLSDLRGDLSE